MNTLLRPTMPEKREQTMTEWKLIPVEPTPEMIAAMAVVEASSTHTNTYNDGSVEHVSCIGMSGAVEAYEALLAALPTPAPTMVDSEYPPLPVDNLLFNTMDGVTYYTAAQMRAYVDADRATRPTPQSLGGDAGVSEALHMMLAAHGAANDGREGLSVLVTREQVEACRNARRALSLTSTEKSDGIDEYEFSELATEHSDETRYDASNKPHEFVFTTAGLHRLIAALKPQDGVVRDMPKYIGDVEWESGNSTLPAAPKAAEKSGRSE